MSILGYLVKMVLDVGCTKLHFDLGPAMVVGYRGICFSYVGNRLLKESHLAQKTSSRGGIIIHRLFAKVTIFLRNAFINVWEGSTSTGLGIW